MNGYTVTEIAEKIEARIVGESGKIINEPVSLQAGNIRQDCITWCRGGNETVLREIKFGTIICEYVDADTAQQECTYLVVNNARKAFQKTMKLFFQRELPTGISPTAVVGKNVALGANVYLGHHVVLEDGCVLGDNCRIDHNTVIRSKTVIGNDVSIGSNTSIGAPGFGFEKNEDLLYELIPHIGNVIIEDLAEIGDNVVIDRAMMGSTVIGKNSKIDNLSYIAHGVKIGRNCLVIGGAIICGSTVVEDNVWISPNATLMNKIRVGEESLIGLGAVVLKDVPPGAKLAGNPARVMSKSEK